MTKPATTSFRGIRAIAFDLDGTLADSVPGLAQALDRALNALNLPAAGQTRVSNWVGNGADMLVDRALSWALAQTASGDSTTISTQPVQHSHLRQQFDRYYHSTATSGSVLYQGVAETLQKLYSQGIPLAIITNKPSKFVAPVLQALGIADYFSLVIGGDDVQQKKPHPAPLYLALSHFGLLASQLLFVGDSRNDILAARAAECPCIGMSYGYNYGEPIACSHPDQVLDHFADLAQLLALPDNQQQESLSIRKHQP